MKFARLLIFSIICIALLPKPARAADPAPSDPAGMTVVLDLMDRYLNLVDRFTHLSKDPTATGVAAVMSANEMLKEQGAQAGIDYFTKALDDVKNESVKRAIRLQLIDLYKNSGQKDKALEQMRTLMVDAPEKDMGPPPPPHPPK